MAGKKNMTLKLLKDTIRKTVDPLEAAILGSDYFLLQRSLNYPGKLNVIWQDIQLRLRSRSSTVQPEITFLLYSKACERLLVPVILNLLKCPEVKEKGIQVNLVVIFGIHRLKLLPSNLQQLQMLGCLVQTDYFSLIRACHQPKQKLVVLCLDHRRPYVHHFWGVDTVDTLKRFGVKTLSIQHGGTRADSVEDLASAASDIVLVWGKRVYREIVEKYRGDSQRFRVVGNPLHDRLAQINPSESLERLTESYPMLQSQLPQKRIILLATTLQAEYAAWSDEQALYRQYMQQIYNDLDFSKYVLVVKMHPLDSLSPNIYRDEIPNAQVESSVIVVEPSVTELDVYSLLSISELLITRASTVAEEALIMGRRVVAFDLMPEGPSRNYKHLEEYGDFTTVYKDTEPVLGTVIDQVISQSGQEGSSDHQSKIIEELTYCLDGKSTDRATYEILHYLFKADFDNSQDSNHSRAKDLGELSERLPC
jgi:hypothetical protein